MRTPHAKYGVLSVLVLGLLLGLLLVAASALAADYPAEYVPGTAYIHPYDGPTWAFWEECDKDGNVWLWDVDTTPNDWWPELPYKAIPADYTVYFAAVFQVMPRGQAVSIAKKFQFDFTIGDRHVTAAEAKRYYGAPVQVEGWEMPTVFSQETPVSTWEIGWLFPVTVAPGTTYSGTMSYAQTAPIVDLIWYGPYDPDDPEYTSPRPSHATPYSSSATYSFTVAPEQP